MFLKIVYTKNMSINVFNRQFKRKYKIVSIFLIIVFLIIICFLAKLMFLDKEEYNNKLLAKTEKIYYGDSPPRGNIYDRNGKMLVGNVLIKSIVFENEDISEEEKINLANKIKDNIIIDYSNLNNDEIKNYYVIKNKENLEERLTRKEKIKKNNKEYSPTEYNILLKEKINEEEIKKLSNEEKEVIKIYSLMNKGYSYEQKVIKEEANEVEFAYFSENENRLKGFKAITSYKRVYPYGEVFKTFLGSIGTIPKEEKEKYLNNGYELNDKVGVSYLEKQYEDYLKGQKESYTVDSKGKKTILTKSVKGNDLYLSIDIELQKDIEEIVKEEMIKAKEESNTKYYNEEFVILSNPKTGEILASVGKQILNNNNGISIIDSMTSLVMNPVTPGSIVKGASHLVGYETGTIYFGKSMQDSCVKILNTPEKCSWKRLGYINDLDALRLSSNYYQFMTAIKIGNGNYRYNRGLKLDKKGFKIYRDMFKQFGLGSETEIDLPEEGKGFVGSDNNVSHLLDFPIGQYDTYTPMQLIQYINTLATSGERYKLHFLNKIISPDEEVVKDNSKTLINKVKAKKENIERVRLGLSLVTQSGGTGNGYIDSYLEPSGKTGTSQSFIDTDKDGKIDTETISTLFGAYMPRSNPKLSIVVLSPNISIEGADYKSKITKRITNKVTNLYFNKYE